MTDNKDRKRLSNEELGDVAGGMNRICIAVLMTVMICAAGCGPSERGRFEATEKLLSAWDKPFKRSQALPQTGPRADYIRLLISEGADVNASVDDNAMADLLTSADALTSSELDAFDNISGSTISGATPLMLAVLLPSPPEVVTLLLDAGAEVNARGIIGMTPLMLAALDARSPEIVTLLIEAGADVNAKSDDGFSALGLADLNTNNPAESQIIKLPEVIKILKAAGAKE